MLDNLVLVKKSLLEKLTNIPSFSVLKEIEVKRTQLVEILKNNEEYKELQLIDGMIKKYTDKMESMPTNLTNSNEEPRLANRLANTKEKQKVLYIIEEYLCKTNNAYLELSKMIDIVRADNLLLNTNRPGAVIGAYLRSTKKYEISDGKYRVRPENCRDPILFNNIDKNGIIHQ